MEVLFIKLLNMSITAGWIVLGVVLLRLALKKAPRWAVCALWALVGVRLVCPVSFESVLSLIPSAETISPNILYSSAPQIHSGIDFINSAVNPALSESFAPDVYASANPMQILAFIAASVWLLGAAAMLLYAAFSYIWLRRRVASAVLLSDNLWQSEAVSSPFVLGIFRPRVYLPFGLDDGGMACVIAHERAHIKRRDHLIKPAAYFLLCVYWFNPFIWLAYMLLCRDIELACDERVVKEMDAGGKKTYSRALLSFSTARNAVLACPLAFGEIGVKLRVKNVLNYKKPAFWIIIAALVLCAAASIFFLSNPKAINPIHHLDGGLSAAVSSAILSENSEGNDGEFQAQAHVVLDTRQSGLNRVTVYALKLYQEYRRAEPGGYELVYGSYGPAAITFAKDSKGGYSLLEYWLPEDGDGYARTLRERFPADLADRVLSANSTSDEMSAACERKAEAYFSTQRAKAYYASSCIYMSPLSSTHPSSDTGCVYFINADERSFIIVDAASGEALESFKDVKWDYKAFTEDEWASWFEFDLGVPNIHSYVNKRSLELSGAYRLIDLDGNLWLMRMGGKAVWSVHELAPRSNGMLTLENVIAFSELGDSLTFDHFRPYAYSDIGSGWYTFVFPINNKWRLTISGNQGFTYGERVSQPVMLEYLPDGESIDIRGGKAAGFIARKDPASMG